MRKLFSLLFCISILASCTVSKDPEFQSVANPKVVKFGLKKVSIEADVVMKNPNDVGVDMTGMEVDIYVNEVHIGKTTQTKAISIPAGSNFNVPLKFDFSPKEVFNLGGLGGIINSLANKTVKMKYKGFVTVNMLGKDIEIPFDYDDEMELKKEQ